MSLFLKRLLLFVTVLLFTSSSWATMVLPLHWSQMTRQASQIFVGLCTETSEELDESDLPATYVRFRVSNGIKGSTTGEDVLIKQFGVERDSLPALREGDSAIVSTKSMKLPGGGFRKGTQYLLFLYPESSMGFTSAVGGGQGQFEIQGEASEERLVISPIHQHLFPSLSTLQVNQKETSSTELKSVIQRVQSLVDREK